MLSFQALLVLIAVPVVTAGGCCLCDHPTVPGWCKTNFQQDIQDFQYCAALAAQLIQVATPTSGQCSTARSNNYNRCCVPNYFGETRPSDGPSGKLGQPNVNCNIAGGCNKPVCNICSDGRFPYFPSTKVAVLDTPHLKTCYDLYEYGLAGTVEGRMCRPMQNYFRGPCGCTQGTTANSPTNNGNVGGGTSVVGGGSSGGGSAPTPPAPTTDANGVVRKKTVAVNFDKDSAKLSAEADKRGNLSRKLRGD